MINFDFNIGNLVLAPLLIPLKTITTALQQSISTHRNLYGNMNDPNSTELVKKREQMTAIDKRRIEILVKVYSFLLNFIK